MGGKRESWNRKRDSIFCEKALADINKWDQVRDHTTVLDHTTDIGEKKEENL